MCLQRWFFIHVVCRIYGDKAADIVEGLKKSPAVAVPIVLKRQVWACTRFVSESGWMDAGFAITRVTGNV